MACLWLCSQKFSIQLFSENYRKMNTPPGDGVEEVRNATLESLRKFLDKLLANNIDQFEVLSLAQRLSVNLDNEDSFSKQKYLVQKSLLEQILKNDRDNMMYKRILEETN